MNILVFLLGVIGVFLFLDAWFTLALSQWFMRKLHRATFRAILWWE
jgi:hypothetical protein